MLCPKETRGQGKGWEVAGTSCVREADALVPSCPGPGKGHIWVVFPGRREAMHVVTAEQGFPTGVHEPVLWELQRKTGKAEVLPRAPQRPRASLGKTLQR